MREAGALRCSVDDALDVYFRQCALHVTATDVAVMAATLANAGRNPRTGERVVEPRVAERVLAVMATCGMYDYAGEWLVRVGLPAKSGVSGGLVAVSPGQFGIGLFSPLLDERGNSVRAIAASHELAERFELHMMHEPGRSGPVVYLAGMPSSPSTRARRWREREVLRRHGTALRVLGVQGDVELAAAETVLHALSDLFPAGPAHGGGWLALDLHRVTRLHQVAVQMLEAFLADLERRGVEVAVADPQARGLLPSAAAELDSLDEALGWCEDVVLARHHQATLHARHMDAYRSGGRSVPPRAGARPR
jgi:glutaminase